VSQLTLGSFEGGRDPLDELTAAEREVYEAVEEDGYGVREYGRRTGRQPGTVGNLLARARDKLEGDDAE